MKLPPPPCEVGHPAVLANSAPILHIGTCLEVGPSAIPIKFPSPLKLAPRPVLVKLAGANFTGGGWVSKSTHKTDIQQEF